MTLILKMVALKSDVSKKDKIRMFTSPLKDQTSIKLNYVQNIFFYKHFSFFFKCLKLKKGLINLYLS